MRFIIPNYCPPDSFVDNVVFTLKVMGHDVITLPVVSNWKINSPYRRYLADIRSKLYPDQLNEKEKWLIKTVKTFKPDVLLTLTQPIREEVLFSIKKFGVKKTVAWWGDTPANMKGRGLLVDGWDFIYFKDRQAVDKCRRIGLNAHLMHEAMNPQWHKPLAKQNNNKIVVAGTFYAYRQMLVSRLINKGIEVELYGGKLPRWVLPEIKVAHTNTFVVKENKSLVFGSAQACLNSTDMSEGNSLNCRAFEIAGAAGLQILEYRPIVNECFEPGKELLTFHSFDELLEIIQKISIDKEFAVSIREAGYKRALNEHTYGHRLNTIIKNLSL